MGNLDRVLQVTVMLALAVASFLALGVTGFNAELVFDYGVRARPSGLTQWFAFAAQHRPELARHLFMTDGASTGSHWQMPVIFMIPALTVLFARTSSPLPWGLLGVQALLVVVDVVQFLSYPALNDGGGVYDISYYYGNHMLFGLACIVFAIVFVSERLVTAVMQRC